MPGGTQHGSSSPGLTRYPSSGGASAERPRHFKQRGFGVNSRTGLWRGPAHAVGPGAYDVEQVGSVATLSKDASYPAQRTLSQHKSPKVSGFGKPKAHFWTSTPPLARSPGPGHYASPDFWDQCWQQNPPRGISFVRQPPSPGQSRFGGLAEGMSNLGRQRAKEDYTM